MYIAKHAIHKVRRRFERNGGQVLENVAAIVTPRNKRNFLAWVYATASKRGYQAEIMVSREKNKREMLCKFSSDIFLNAKMPTRLLFLDVIPDIATGSPVNLKLFYNSEDR